MSDFNELKFLKQYERKKEGNEVLMPSEDFKELCQDLSALIKDNIYSKKNIENIQQHQNKIIETYLDHFSQSFINFAEMVNSQKLTINDHPIKDWKWLANDENTRFVLPSFYKLAGNTIENMNVKNYDVFIFALKTLNPKEISQIIANFSSPDTVINFVRDLKKIAPDVLQSDKFNPIEDMLNEGNGELFKNCVKNNDIFNLIRDGDLKSFYDLSIDTNLLLRLNSDFDLRHKKNIVKAIMVANENGFLENHLKDMDKTNKDLYGKLSNIDVDSVLGYKDIYLFSMNEVSLFENNNERLVNLKQSQDEKLNIKEKSASHKVGNRAF